MVERVFTMEHCPNGCRYDGSSHHSTGEVKRSFFWSWVQVVCFFCHCSGPRCKTDGEAVDKWDRLSRKSKG